MVATGREYAMKKMEKRELRSRQMRELLLSELQVLQRIEHKNLMPLIEILENDNEFFLICELAYGKDLQYRLEKIKKFNEK